MNFYPTKQNKIKWDMYKLLTLWFKNKQKNTFQEEKKNIIPLKWASAQTAHAQLLLKEWPMDILRFVFFLSYYFSRYRLCPFLYAL